MGEVDEKGGSGTSGGIEPEVYGGCGVVEVVHGGWYMEVGGDGISVVI